MVDRSKRTVAILAGPRSPALEKDQQGIPWIRRISRIARAHAQSVLVVVSPSSWYVDVEIPWGVEILVDEMPEKGSLGGICTAMKRVQTPYLVCLASQAPMVDEGKLEILGAPERGEDAVFEKTTYFPMVFRNDRKILYELIRHLETKNENVEQFLESISARSIDLVLSKQPLPETLAGRA